MEKKTYQINNQKSRVNYNNASHLCHLDVNVGGELEGLGRAESGVERAGSHEQVVELQALLAPLLRLEQKSLFELFLRPLQVLPGYAEDVLESHLRSREGEE